ncbi:MAG: putative glycoside hydrolase/deacetylase ChbG (UPF0249 family) [Flavobacteriales bacterium]|jgi:predicted glycoside hydrolase/deacetylase ChbG (UPF0249 family)
MRRSKLQKRLGYALDQKLLIIHADDAGLCHSANAAIFQSMEQGSVNSASIMVSCPWYLEAVSYCKSRPDLDFGVHITLTSEWDTYKWGPISDRALVPTLVDENGYFFGHDFYTRVDPKEAALEARAQIDRALSDGIKISHLDCHMNCMLSTAELFSEFKKISSDYALPMMVSKGYGKHFGYDLDDHLDKNAVIVNEIHMSQPANTQEGIEHYYDSVLNELGAGLSVLLVHPAHDDSEMHAISKGVHPWGADWRNTDYKYFCSERCEKLLLDNDIKLITWGEVKEKLFV